MRPENVIPCPDCNKAGTETEIIPWKQCELCAGQRWVYMAECQECHGTGTGYGPDENRNACAYECDQCGGEGERLYPYEDENAD